MCFFALSHAPPAFAIIRASSAPHTVVPASRPPSAFTPSPQPTTNGASTAMSPGSTISRNAARVVMSTHRALSGLGLALHQARDLAELPPDFLDDLACRAPDGRHRQRRDHERHRRTDEQPHQHVGVREVQLEDLARRRHGARIGGEQRQGREHRGTDREALADRSSRVAERVEFVGHLADFGPRCAISAMPPALSATGPYASTVIVMPTVPSMPTAASAMP
jgi:hypothetical protein